MIGTPRKIALKSLLATACALSLGLSFGLSCLSCKATGRKDTAPEPSVDERGPKFDAHMIPSVDVPRFEPAETSTIKIDGALDEQLWEKAARTGVFVDVGSGKIRKDLPVQAEARLLYDDLGVYIGIEVKDGDVRGGFPKDAIDPHLWERDTVEIMTKPSDDGTNRDYYELQINPQNLVFDSHFDDYNAPKGGPNGPFGHQDFKASLKSAVVVHGSIDDDTDTDEGYTVEAYIDFHSFSNEKAPDFRGKTLRMNFYAMQNNGGTGWSPILGEGNFHKASRFGRVHFVP